MNVRILRPLSWLIIFLFVSYFNGPLFSQLSSENLLAYYPFNGDVKDLGPSGYHGIMSGGIFVANAEGIANSALKLDGINDYVDLTAFANDFRDNLGQMTIYFLIKFDSQISNQTILSLGNHGESLNSNVFEVEFENNQFQVETEISTAAVNIELEIDQASNVVDLNWHEIFIRIDGESLEYCRDGELIYAGLYRPAETTTDELFLGSFDGDGVHDCCHLNGVIDELQFYSSLKVEVNDTLMHTSCESEEYQTVINNTVYDITNPSGTEIISSDCFRDTILTIDLAFIPSYEITIEEMLCKGSNYQLEVNQTIYDINNPSGLEVLSTIGGCDSTIMINLNYTDEVIEAFNVVNCDGEDYSVEINGTVYNQANPTGVEIFNLDQCDSIVMVNLEFAEPSTDSILYSGCREDGYSVVVNDIIYDETNPEGVEVLQNSFGCDSLIYIDLEYIDRGCDFFIPNVINTRAEYPNNTFQIYTSDTCEYTIEKFLIFDRWGAMVYAGEGPVSWDGVFNGKKVGQGGYVYYLVIDNQCGKVTRTGSIIVLN